MKLRLFKCRGCGQEMDPDVCWCGDGVSANHDVHGFVPMGCDCFRDTEDDAVKAWDGGRPPQLTKEDGALLGHVESCDQCSEHFIVNMCEEGRRLLALVDATYKEPDAMSQELRTSPIIADKKNGAK